MGDLEEIFRSFCSFGAGSKDAMPLMDNAKFAKFFRDTKLLDKKVTATDVDIVFNKVKAKAERKITFEQFQEGLRELAQKKYPGDKDSYGKMVKKIKESQGPKVVGATTVKTTEAIDRLTDTSKYTGTHKQRFDETGKGRGLAGRDSVAKGQGMSAGSVGGMEGYVHGYKHEGTYDKKVSK